MLACHSDQRSLLSGPLAMCIEVVLGHNLSNSTDTSESPGESPVSHSSAATNLVSLFKS